MSGKVVGMAFDCELDVTEKYVLVALADHADHEGNNVRPGVDLIAWKTGLSVRAVQYSIRKLESDGYLERVTTGTGGRGRVTEYRICVERLPIRQRVRKGAGYAPIIGAERVQDMHRSETERVHLTTQKGASDDTKGASTPINKEPSIEPSSLAPSGEKEKRARKINPGWTPSAELSEWAQEERGCTAAQVAEETERFRDHFTASGKPAKDWEAAFRNWIRRAPEFTNGNGKANDKTGSSIESAYDHFARRNGGGLR